MDHRLYFILGDLLTNILLGVAVAVISWLLIDTSWNMYLSILVMLLLGIIVATMLSLPFIYFFGAMEVLMPGMFTGMMSGMVTGMWMGMETLSLLFVLFLGSFSGFVSIMVIWILNSRINGIQSRQTS